MNPDRLNLGGESKQQSPLIAGVVMNSNWFATPTLRWVGRHDKNLYEKVLQQLYVRQINTGGFKAVEQRWIDVPSVSEQNQSEQGQEEQQPKSKEDSASTPLLTPISTPAAGG